MQLILGYLAYQIYVVEEELPFPRAKAKAETVITLVQREPKKTRAMLMGFVITFIYSLIAYGPYILGMQRIIPIPFIDFTIWTESYLPGALIGIATDFFSIFNGFI